MNTFTLPPQNFAVASAARPAKEPRKSGEKAGELVSLAAARIRAWQHWRDLCGDADVWTDRKKRGAMYRARWQYHDAVFDWLHATHAPETA